MLLEVQNLSLSYGPKKVLKNLSFQMNEGEILCLLGESGCGKTSLLKAIRGFMDRDNGEIYFNDNRVYNKSEKLVPGTKGVAIVHQDFQLQPGYTVFENIRHHLIEYSRDYQNEKTQEIINLCNLNHLQDKKSNELSGGQKQKVALAKAIIEESPLILLDEPFSNLDTISKADFKQVLKNVVDELNIGLLFVTHDYDDALTFSDNILIIENGEAHPKSSPEKIINQPFSFYSARLTGLKNIFPKDVISSHYHKTKQADIYYYWVPQRYIEIKEGGDFTIRSYKHLGNYFEYVLSNNILSYQYISVAPLKDVKYDILINKVIPIPN